MPKIDFANARILVVDDQRPFILLLKGILINLGARQITLTTTGEEALNACKSRSYDIYLVDYNLGRGRNGRQLLEELRQKKLLQANAIYMIITGDNTRPMVLGAVESQPDDYLMKPFSQNVLKSRLQRIHKKKQALQGIYRALNKKRYEQVIEQSRAEIEKNSRYSHFCYMLCAEVMCNLKQYKEAEDLLKDLILEQNPTWAQLIMAKVQLLQKKYKPAENRARAVLKQNNLLVEAHDIITQSLFKQNQIVDALKNARQAIELSPHSLERQHMMVEIAQANEAYPELIHACQAILDLTRKTHHQDVRHLLNYIRSIVNAVEGTEEQTQRNRFQQEAVVALQRGRNDECVPRSFPYEAFEQLCNARLDLAHGRLLQAKKKTYKANTELDEEALEDSQQMLPDTISVMYQIGETDDAKRLLEKLDDIAKQDKMISNMLEQAEKKSNDMQESFQTHNKNGIEKFKNGQFSEAITDFEQALRIAPVHTGSALNLIQACLKELENQKKPDHDLISKVKGAFKIVDGVPLSEAHKQRYRDLRQEFSQYKS